MPTDQPQQVTKRPEQRPPTSIHGRYRGPKRQAPNPVPAGVIDTSALPEPDALPLLFDQPAPLVLDIGFGKGELLAHMAQTYSHWNFIGCEIFYPGIDALCKQIEQRQLHNVKIVLIDARDLIANYLTDACLERVHLFFPDPWPKRRHQKRRLIQPDFCQLIHRRLKPLGSVHLATDSEALASWIPSCFKEPDLWQAASDPQTQALVEQNPSRFAQRGLRKGHSIHQFSFKKRQQ
ncbi:MAG: tRNA (guanosine(46)-N7)-methyltransferase TrmB [Gammaproteobacteria bacterium]